MIRALAVAICLVVAGCSSIVGTITHPAPYIGVTLDASGVVNGSGPTPLFCAVDLPLSFVLDTAFLPFTALVWAAQKQDGAK